MLRLRKFLYHFLIPGGLILPASMWLHHWSERPETLEQALEVLPFIVLAAGAFLGWRFNRSRLLLVLLVLVVADRAIALSGETAHPELVFGCVAFLLPLNFVWIAWITERGLVSTFGFMRLFTILVQPVAVDLLLRTEPERLGAFLNAEIAVFSFSQEWGLSQAAVAAFMLALVLLTVRFWRRPQVFEGTLLWALFAGISAVRGGDGESTTFFMTVSGLMMTVAVLESSYFMAFRDELTGLPSRRALNEYLLRSGSRYTVAMLDVDHFKKVNDTHGHDVGDQVLKMVASRLSRVGAGGKAFRYGGEEFAVVFPGRGCEECIPYLEELREEIAGSGFTLRGPERPNRKPKNTKSPRRGRKQIKVTVSIGAAGSDRRKGTAEALIKTADECLYKAKQGGRNQVRAAT